MRERFDEKYVKIGATLFLSGAAIILFFSFVQNLAVIRDGVNSFIGILMPFIYGLVMAYLLCPVYNAVVRRTYHFLNKNASDKNPNHRKYFTMAKVAGSTVSLLFLLFILSSLLALLIPQIIQSIIALIEVVPGRLNDLSEWVNTTLVGTRYETIAKNFDRFLNNSFSYLTQWLNEHILPNATDYISKVSEGIFVTIRSLLNLLIGIIVMLYFLNNKERFRAQAKKIINAAFNRNHAGEIFEFGNFVNRTFGGFINGKIIDSLIIGFICFVIMMILKLPYAALCSTIIGVTNIIPFFGPFIGAVPTTIIILVVSPIQALEFLIVVFALQQFDGNILGPRILGETTGLASFWVMFAIIFFGGLFGFVGMLLGVPTFAVFYHYYKRYVEKRLRRKGLPVETQSYQDFNKYDINRKDLL